MKPHSGFALGAILCLLLTSCVVSSDNPLTSPETAKPDSQLVGHWRTKSDPDEVLVFSVKNEHWMHMESRKKGQQVDAYNVFVSVIDGQHYLNVFYQDKDDQGHVNGNGYIINRYQISDHHVLTLWWMDNDKIADAIQAGKLKGVVHEDKPASGAKQLFQDKDVALQDTGANIVKFIRQTGHETLFDVKSDELYRVDAGER